MADIFTKSKRSFVMSRIRSRGNKDTELALAKLFRAQRITGWRRHVRVRIAERGVRNQFKTRIGERGVRNSKARAAVPLRIPNSKLRTFAVRPDFVFPKRRLAVFVDGCFWHGCPKHGTQPVTRRAFWKNKFTRNKTRDRLVNRTLRQRGWRVLRIWQHELTKRNENRLISRLQRVFK